VGPTTAASVLKEYGSLEAALAAGRFSTQHDELLLFKRIATLDRSAPVPPLPDQEPTWTAGAELAREWGLPRLAERLAALA